MIPKERNDTSSKDHVNFSNVLLRHVAYPTCFPLCSRERKKNLASSHPKIKSTNLLDKSLPTRSCGARAKNVRPPRCESLSSSLTTIRPEETIIGLGRHKAAYHPMIDGKGPRDATRHRHIYSLRAAHEQRTDPWPKSTEILAVPVSLCGSRSHFALCD